MLKISEIYIYPVKSLGALRLQEADVTDRGLKHDRRWMLVDDNGQFLSQRTCAAMALFHLEGAQEGFKIYYQPDGTYTFISYEATVGLTLPVTIWDDICTGTLVNDMASEWFSSKLQRNCRLVYMAQNSQRPVDERYAHHQELVSFADAYPFLLIGQSSMNLLNQQLDTPVGVNRFRPNIVFTGGEPHQEDMLAHIRINHMDFYGVKPCARCVMIGIDPLNGQTGKEPTHTLARYRTWNKKIYFGQNLIHQGSGKLAVGDRIQILKTKADFIKQPVTIPLYDMV